MEKEIKKIFKVIFVWQDDKEEEWLNEMARKGWLLEKYTFCVYTFYKSEPKEYIYKLDYKRIKYPKDDEYLKLFRDSGWEYVDNYMNWHYFRSEKGKSLLPDIYSDYNSKIEKYKRVLGLLLPITFFNIFNLFNMTLNESVYELKTRCGIIGLVSLVVLLMIYGDIKVFLKIWKLKKGKINL
ncbi:DUF2812 domain-containing protein [Clostridium sp. DL1XJH146]